ncbi:MAG: ribonuclease P [Methanotrichaceae archaeon]|nr:ribonuclease P [Methanotrichaceae archaeon]
MRYKKQVQNSRKIALERIELLFALANEEHKQHPERSDRYVQIARKISTRIRVKMPARVKRQFCKSCGRFLPASKARVRLKKGVLTITCVHCGAQSRRKYHASLGEN